MTINFSDSSHPVALEYAGFGPRLLAMILDGILITLLSAPILVSLYGSASPDPSELPEAFSEAALYVRGPGEFFFKWIFPGIFTIALWHWICATPAKLVLRMAVVDAKTGRRASLFQYTIRYLAYFISALPLLLGYFAVLWDDRNQAWHDKIAGTVVIVNEGKKADL